MNNKIFEVRRHCENGADHHCGFYYTKDGAILEIISKALLIKGPRGQAFWGGDKLPYSYEDIIKFHSTKDAITFLKESELTDEIWRKRWIRCPDGDNYIVGHDIH